MAKKENFIDPELWAMCKVVFLVLFIMFVSITGCHSIRTIQPGFVGVAVRLGSALENPLNEGIHVVIPWITHVKAIDCRVQRSETKNGEAVSEDLQVVKADLVVNYHLEKKEVVQLYRSVGITYEEVILAPAIFDCLKANTAKYKAELLITQRPKLADDIKQALASRMEPYGIIIDQVNITNLDFSKEFNNAIEQKVVMEQTALKAKAELERVKFEAEQAKMKATGEADAVLEKAKAEAESLKLRAEAVTPMVMALDFVTKWNGELPKTVFIGSDNVTPLINIDR